MKVKEFVEKYKKVNSNATKNFIKVKYLPFNEKQALVDGVIEQCILMDDGIIHFDEMQKYIIFTITIIQTYTEIEFDADFNVAIQEYDMLCEAGLLNWVIESFEVEYNTVLNMMNIKTEEILKQNNFEYQIAKFLNHVSEKFDEITPAMINAVNALDFENLGINQDDIKSLKDFIHLA